MKTKIMTLLAAVVAVLGVTTTTLAAPAHAGPITIKHAWPDNGYNPAILVQCGGVGGQAKYLDAGESSSSACGGISPSKVYVNAGAKIACRPLNSSQSFVVRWNPPSAAWISLFYETGNIECVYRLD